LHRLDKSKNRQLRATLHLRYAGRKVLSIFYSIRHLAGWTVGIELWIINLNQVALMSIGHRQTEVFSRHKPPMQRCCVQQHETNQNLQI